MSPEQALPISRHHQNVLAGRCTRCGTVISLEEPFKSCASCRDRRRVIRQTPEQRLRRNAYNQQWKRANPAKHYTRTRNRLLKYNYGITLEEYNKLLKLQGGVCKICSKSNQMKKALFVDHNHVTGIVRGLLCWKCNQQIGWLEKYPDQIQEHLKSNVKSIL